MNGISRAINQKKFKNEYHKNIVSIIYVSHLLKNNLQTLLKTYKITEQQYNILRILRGSRPEPCTIGILKARMLDKMSDASRLVDRLLILKLVERCENEADRRAVNVSISEKGLDVLAQVDMHDAEFEKILKCVSEDEIKQLASILDKIIDFNLDN